ncbi:MAG TPA: plastocyanin/azurin family copper-binding protein [Acidimicrobiia bacterium]|nr:plastocyanin/azurin family copper-binding protein [Acidimicrobiia bacterium]
MASHRKAFVVVFAALAAAGCGGDHDSHGGSDDPTRTIDVVMKEFAYEPAAVTVTAGETVKFVFRNEGQILHESFIGDEAAQQEHEKAMREHKDDHEGHAVKVIPGKTGSLTYTFDKAGETLIIGCHETGHWPAGMKMTVTVS